MPPQSTRSNWRRRGALIFACIAVAVVAWLGVSVYDAGRRRTSVPQGPIKEPNLKLVKDVRGHLLMEIRWPKGGGPVVRMRVPAALNWMGGLDAGGLVGPGYQDPDVVGPSQRTLILEALLPDFEARTTANAGRFKASIAGEAVRIKVVAASPVAIDGKPIIDRLFRFHLSTLVPLVYRKLYHVELADKPDRFGLKHKGAVGDFERFRRWGSVDDIYFPDIEPKPRFMVCGAEEIKDISEDSSWNKHPLCNHYYYSNQIGGTTILTYRRIYLREWAAIETAAEKLFAAFEYRAIHD